MKSVRVEITIDIKATVHGENGVCSILTTCSAAGKVE